MSLKSYKCLHFQPKIYFSHIHIHTYNLYFPSSSIISHALCKYFDDPSLLVISELAMDNAVGYTSLSTTTLSIPVNNVQLSIKKKKIVFRKDYNYYKLDHHEI